MIITTGNSRHLSAAAFILAGITAVALNGFPLMNFIEQPLAKKSEILQRVIMKWEPVMQKTDSAFSDRMESAESENILEHPETPQAKDQSAIQPKSALPVLSGVLQVSDVYKRTSFIAIMEGKQLKKHDQINDFIITDITAKGVVLSKNGQTWFVATPNVFFSLIRKEANSGSKPR